ncbi:MAG TPA: hypothetical protein VJL57_02845 [Candidatus Paceibacterota bacterium]
MAKTMLASGMTDGQIDDLANKLRDAARKHRDEIGKDPAQEALRSENIGMRLLAEFLRIVDEVSGYVVRTVTVDRTRTMQQSLDATGRRQYVNKDVVATMPRREGSKARLVYFKPVPGCYKNGFLSCEALDAEYKKRGLVPDPQAQADDNAADPTFADTTPNACRWTDEHGNHCYAAFDRWGGVRYVGVDRSGLDWDDYWSFAGVPQGSSASAV